MRRSLPTLLAALVLALGLVACDGDQAQVEENPTEALRDAISQLGDYDGLELTFAIDGDRDAIARSMADEDVDAEDLELLLESSFVLRTTGEDEDTEVQVLVNLRDSEAFDLRFIGGDRLFVRVDLDAVASEIDEVSEEDLDGLVGMGQMFGLGEAAQALRAGDWIEVTGIEQMMDMFQAETGTDTDTPSEEELAQIQKRVSAALERFVSEDAQVTAVGSEDAGERVRVQATGEDLERLFTELAEIVEDVGGGVDPTADLDGEFEDVDSVTIDAWISGGELSQIGLDIGQFGDEVEENEVFVLIGIAEFTGNIDAPDDATTLDLFEVMGGFLGGFDGGFDEPGGFDDDFADEDFDIEGTGECITDEELDQLREVMGEEEADEFEQLIDIGVIERC